MAVESYSHDSAMVTIRNCLNSDSPHDDIIKIRLPKGLWQKKLNRINTKIHTKWNLSHNNQWLLSINNHHIQPNDIAKFEQIACQLPPPIHIDIIQVWFIFQIKNVIVISHNIYVLTETEPFYALK